MLPCLPAPESSATHSSLMRSHGTQPEPLHVSAACRRTEFAPGTASFRVGRPEGCGGRQGAVQAFAMTQGIRLSMGVSPYIHCQPTSDRLSIGTSCMVQVDAEGLLARGRGAVQAGAMAYGMWLLSTGVDAYFDRQAMPDQFTARNITVTVRTITRGLAYLATFIFGANAVGLSGALLSWHGQARDVFLACV